MNVKILRGTIVDGKPALPGDIVNVNVATGAMLVRSHKAELVDSEDKQAAENVKNQQFARNPNDLMGNDDPRVTPGGAQETPTELKDVTPPGTTEGGTPGKVEISATGSLTDAVKESSPLDPASTNLDDDFDDNLNDPLGLHPTGGLTTKSAKPIMRAEKR